MTLENKRTKLLLAFGLLTNRRRRLNHHLPSRHRRLPNHLHRRSSMSPQLYTRHINSKTYPIRALKRVFVIFKFSNFILSFIDVFQVIYLMDITKKVIFEFITTNQLCHPKVTLFEKDSSKQQYSWCDNCE
jgi:hypothetical protein